MLFVGVVWCLGRGVFWFGIMSFDFLAVVVGSWLLSMWSMRLPGSRCCLGLDVGNFFLQQTKTS